MLLSNVCLCIFFSTILVPRFTTSKMSPELEELDVHYLDLLETGSIFEADHEETMVLQPGETLELECRGNNYPVFWLIPDELEVTQGDQPSSSRFLILSNVTAQHTGLYICLYLHSKNLTADTVRDSTIASITRVFVSGGHQIFVPSSSFVLPVHAGNPVLIPCVTTSPNASVSLIPITTTQTSHIIYNGTKPGPQYFPSLGFHGILPSGTFKCQAELGERKEETELYNIIVIPVSLPQPNIMSETCTPIVGEDISIFCFISGSKIVHFNWIYPGLQLGRNQTKTEMDLEIGTWTEHFCGLQPEFQAGPNIGDDAEPWIKSSLTIHSAKLEDTGEYTCTAETAAGEGNTSININVLVPPFITSLEDVAKRGLKYHRKPGFGSHRVICVAKGQPTPDIEWYSCSDIPSCIKGKGPWTVVYTNNTMHGSGASISVARGKLVGQSHIDSTLSGSWNQPERSVASTLTFKKLSQPTAVRCVARNVLREDERIVELPIQDSQLGLTVAVSTLVPIICIAAVAIIVLAVWKKRPRYEVRWQVISVDAPGHSYTYIDPRNLPYDCRWEIPRDNLILGRVLGSGAFGQVIEATVLGTADGNSFNVAVKMLQPTARTCEKQALMSELKIMTHLGAHLNIVNLIGACTLGGPVYIVTEYCCHGDLVGYLHRYKHLVLNESRDTASSCPTNYMEMNEQNGSQYITMASSPGHMIYADLEGSYLSSLSSPENIEDQMPVCPLSLLDLRYFSYQAARGMEFLASHNCVHRDLAARNVLLGNERMVKICDFGLARDLSIDANYISKGTTFLPVKWMAPESIFHSLYTPQSDVWSYGVLLWEIFTLGESPYPGMTVDSNFYTRLREGYRMEKPKLSSDNIYQLMGKCWNSNADKRPTFTELAEKIGQTLPQCLLQAHALSCSEFESAPPTLMSHHVTAPCHLHAPHPHNKVVDQSSEACPGSTKELVYITPLHSQEETGSFISSCYIDLKVHTDV
uniref:receptor protein-tyrosine kinase n=1 Tax=Eptatretus burgeri TaxID=7764 RepID=A0A8C4R1R4_EPTBU